MPNTAGKINGMKSFSPELSSDKLIHLLTKYRKTNRDLARYLNITPVAISKWTHNAKTIPKCHYSKIAEFFGITMEELLKDTDAKYKDIYKTIIGMSEQEKLDLIAFTINSIKR